jgi:hypothetical protein
MRKHVVRSLILFVVLCVAAGAHAQWPLGRDVPQIGAKSEDHPPQVTATGRFQIFVSPQAKGYTFMLDTDTGRIWILKKDHTSGDFSMSRIPVEQVETEQAAKPAAKKAKPGEPESAKPK